MGVSGAKWRDFIVYMKKGFSVERIPFDAGYWETLKQKLCTYYFTHFIKIAESEFAKCSTTTFTSFSAVIDACNGYLNYYVLMYFTYILPIFTFCIIDQLTCNLQRIITVIGSKILFIISIVKVSDLQS